MSSDLDVGKGEGDVEQSKRGLGKGEGVAGLKNGGAKEDGEGDEEACKGGKSEVLVWIKWFGENNLSQVCVCVQLVSNPMTWLSV